MAGRIPIQGTLVPNGPFPIVDGPVKYTAANAPSWPEGVPTEAGDALDKLAARAGAHVFSSNFPGADLGQQINAADAFLGAGHGTIEVPDGNYTTAAPISLSANRELILGRGLYASTVANSPTWLFSDNTIIRGKGWETVIEESTDTSTTYALYVMSPASNIISGSANGATNVLLEDFCVRGANPSFVGASATPTVSIGNSKNVMVNRVAFDSVKSLALVIGSASDAGFFAENVWVTNCKFVNVGSQNCSCVNGKKIFIHNNLFLAAGVPLDVTNATYIDFEPNEITDLIEAFEICGNIFDTRGCLVSGNGIVIQDAAGRAGIGKGLIANNVFIGDDGGGNFSSAVFLVGMTDITVTGNQIRRTASCGIVLDTCHGCHVGNNLISECGGGGNPSMALIDSTRNHIVGNTFAMADASVGGQDARLTETGTSDYNTIECNKFDRYLGTGGIQGVVSYVGANTVVRHNDYAGHSANQTAAFDPFAVVSASRAVKMSDETIFVDTTAADVTITLPDATEVSSNVSASRRLTIKRIAGTHNVVLASVSAQTFDGAAGPLTISDDNAHNLQADAAGWRTLDSAAGGSAGVVASPTALRASALHTSSKFVKMQGFASSLDGGEGDWYWDAASTDADNTGTVIQPASVSGAGRWKRSITDGRINVAWFGARPTTAAENFDSLFAFDAAMLATGVPYANTDQSYTGLEVFVPPIPKTYTETFYRLSGPWHIKRQSVVRGVNGAGSWSPSKLKFDLGVSGIVIDSVFDFTGPRGDFSKVYALQVFSSFRGDVPDAARWQPSTSYNVGDIIVPRFSANRWGWAYKCTTAGVTGATEPAFPAGVLTPDAFRSATYADGTAVWTTIEAHGIDVRANFVQIVDCYVHHFPGNGINAHGASDSSTYNSDTADICQITGGGTRYNGGSGISFAGHDGNAGYVKGVSSTGNLGWGFRDDSVLGQMFYSCHSDANLRGMYYTGRNVDCYSEGGTVAFIPGMTWIGGIPGRFTNTYQKPWVAGETVVVADDTRVPTTPNGYQYVCLTAGVTGAVEPTWPVDGNGQVTDGTAVWYCFGEYASDNSQSLIDYVADSVHPRTFVDQTIAKQHKFYAGWPQNNHAIWGWHNGDSQHTMQADGFGAGWDTLVTDNASNNGPGGAAFAVSSNVASPTWDDDVGGGRLDIPWPFFIGSPFGSARIKIYVDIVPPSDVSSAWKTEFWRRGSFVFNRNGDGAVLGWQCTADGTPGTWAAIGGGAPVIPGAPTIAAGTASGGSVDAAVVGNQECGTVTFTAGVTPNGADAPVFTLTLASPYPTGCVAEFFPANAAAAVAGDQFNIDNSLYANTAAGSAAMRATGGSSGFISGTVYKYHYLIRGF
jgi:parallel beta-helix repeat protein